MSEATDDSTTPEPTTPPAPDSPASSGPSGGEVAVYILGLVTVVLWVIPLQVAITGYSDFRDLRDNSFLDLSAPQVGQLGTEYIAGLMPWLTIALAATALTLIIAASTRD